MVRLAAVAVAAVMHNPALKVAAAEAVLMILVAVAQGGWGLEEEVAVLPTVQVMAGL
jgi:hypothetical protein